MSQPSLARRSAVALGTGLALVAVTVAPAAADVPEGWSDPAEMSWLHLLALVAGIPTLMGVVITAVVLIPSLVRGEGLPTGKTHDDWVGGPQQGTAELREADHAGTGGASARF
jgi:hypothetical protein